MNTPGHSLGIILLGKSPFAIVSCILHGRTHRSTLSRPETRHASLAYPIAGCIARHCHTLARRRLNASGTPLSHPGVLSLSCQVSCALLCRTHHSTPSHPATSQISLTYLIAGFIARHCHTSARRRLAASVKSLSPPVDVMPSVLHSASPPFSASAVVGNTACLASL